MAGKGLVRSQDDGGDDAVFAHFENTRPARREPRLTPFTPDDLRPIGDSARAVM